jgi:hypothetical protein
MVLAIKMQTTAAWGFLRLSQTHAHEEIHARPRFMRGAYSTHGIAACLMRCQSCGYAVQIASGVTQSGWL